MCVCVFAETLVCSRLEKKQKKMKKRPIQLARCAYIIYTHTVGRYLASQQWLMIRVEYCFFKGDEDT